MENEKETKEQLMEELTMPRREIAELKVGGSTRMRDEDALRESENRFRLLFKGAGDDIFILQAEGGNAGQIVAANRAATDLHGYTVDELQSLNSRDLDAFGADVDAGGQIERMLKGEWTKEEITHRKKDGTVFPSERGAGLLELGKDRYILAFDRDITGHRGLKRR